MRGPFPIGVLDVRFFIVLISITVHNGFGKEDQNRKTYVVRYKNGDSTIPVTVVLDYKKQVEYVINMNPRTPTKSVTFYDFKQKSIAYKDMTNKECFLSQLTHENLQEENEILESLQNPVETKPLLLTLDSTRRSLTPTQIRNLAGQKIAMFCRKMATWRLQENQIQERSRREVHSGRLHGSNNPEKEVFLPYSQESSHQSGYSTPSTNTHRKRKTRQEQRKGRNILTPKDADSQSNVYHRQAFHQHFGSDSLPITPENNYRKITQRNSQNRNHMNKRRSHHQNLHTLSHPRFQNNLYPRSQPYYNNFNIEDKIGDPSRTLESVLLPPPRQPSSYDPNLLSRPVYQLPDVEPRHRFHSSPVFNQSSEAIFEQWSHPLRIPKRKFQLPHQTFDSHYDSDINSAPYDHFQGYVQPLHRTKPGTNDFGNKWSLPLRYNSSNTEQASFFSDSKKPLLNSNVDKQDTPIEHSNKNSSLYEFAYDTFNDSVIEEKRPVYQTLFYNTKTPEEPTPIPEISLNFKEIENEDNSKDSNKTLEDNFNTNTPQDFKILVNVNASQETMYKAPKRKEISSSPTDEDFVLVNYSQSKNSSTSDQDTFRHHTQLGQQNGTLDYYPKRQERIQSALKLFTPDEIVIDIGKYPTENQIITPTPSFSDYPAATHRPRIVESPTRTLQQQGNDKPIIRPPPRNSYQNPSKDRFVNHVPDRNIYVANHNVVPSVTDQQPQHMPAVLPPGFAIYPRHPKAPYASLASPNTQQTIPPLRMPNNHHIPRQHHQRHHNKRRNNLCCSMPNASPRSGNCCASRRSCCTTRHRGQHSSSCCPKVNDSRKVPKAASSTAEERAPADQQYNSPEVANSKTFCEEQKMCRTLYQSTKAVMLCRNGHVPGC